MASSAKKKEMRTSKEYVKEKDGDEVAVVGKKQTVCEIVTYKLHIGNCWGWEQFL